MQKWKRNSDVQSVRGGYLKRLMNGHGVKRENVSMIGFSAESYNRREGRYFTGRGGELDTN